MKTILLLFGYLLGTLTLARGQAVPTVFTGLTLIDGTGRLPVENAVLLVSDGRIQAINPAAIPANAQILDYSGKFIIPGLINTHAHVGYKGAVNASNYSTENIQDQLERYARYGITTVASLGEDREESRAFRDVYNHQTAPERARLFTAGEIIYGSEESEVRGKVQKNVQEGVDFIKIRVDRNRGRSQAMPASIYRVIIDEAHKNNKMLMAHMYDLDLAKDLVTSGADFLAHSVRDQEADKELITMLKQKNVCYCPTLTRDLSTFVYGGEADFLNDPYFLKDFVPQEFAHLLNATHQNKIKNSSDYTANKAALAMAAVNLKKLSEGGVKIAMGTDSGMPDRFQGYFEHLEMEMMQEAGISPEIILRSATSTAASCLKMKDLGTLEPGKLADFLILNANPLQDVRNLRSIEAVFIGGKPLAIR